MSRRNVSITYTRGVPKLWSETLVSHKREIRDAILEATARLVRQHGLLSVTMSRIAEETGIGRATLYKYFPDVEAILRAWHERQISRHLQQLSEARDRAGSPMERLQAVFVTYATISRDTRRHWGADLAAFLHNDEQVLEGERRLRSIVRGLVIAAVDVGEVRDDVPPEELASYCLHSLGAARAAGSKAAIGRLVDLVIAAVRPPG